MHAYAEFIAFFCGRSLNGCDNLQDKVEVLTSLKKINQLPSRNAKYVADENNSKTVMVNSNYNSVQKASLQVNLNDFIKVVRYLLNFNFPVG